MAGDQDSAPGCDTVRPFEGLSGENDKRGSRPMYVCSVAASSRSTAMLRHFGQFIWKVLFTCQSDIYLRSLCTNRRRLGCLSATAHMQDSRNLAWSPNNVLIIHDSARMYT